MLWTQRQCLLLLEAACILMTASAGQQGVVTDGSNVLQYVRMDRLVNTVLSLKCIPAYVDREGCRCDLVAPPLIEKQKSQH